MILFVQHWAGYLHLRKRHFANNFYVKLVYFQSNIPEVAYKIVFPT
jgi:hypothetical protein